MRRGPRVVLSAQRAGGALAAASGRICVLLARSRRPWYTRLGVTDAEVHGALPGDELVPDSGRQMTLVVTVQAPPEAVWP